MIVHRHLGGDQFRVVSASEAAGIVTGAATAERNPVFQSVLVGVLVFTITRIIDRAFFERKS